MAALLPSPASAPPEGDSAAPDGPAPASLLERLLAPIASLVYGPPVEGDQPPGLGVKLFALAVLLAFVGLALLTTLRRPDFGTQHGPQRSCADEHSFDQRLAQGNRSIA